MEEPSINPIQTMKMIRGEYEGRVEGLEMLEELEMLEMLEGLRY